MLAQVRSIDADLEKVVDAYNAAQMRLDAIREDQRENRRLLRIARANFAASQALLEQRLLALYRSDDATVAEILLGAQSLDDLLARVETVDRVSEQDARVVREVRAFRTEVRHREAKLAKARTEQEQVVAERAERRRVIEAQLAERRRLLASIKSEIAKLQAAEAERQRRLEEQARKRLAQAQSAQQSSGSGAGSSGSGAGSSESGAGSSASGAGSSGSGAGSSGSGAGSSGSGAGSSGSGGDSAPAFGGSIGSPPPGRYGGVVGIAMQYLGVPYRWGGASPRTGFDCSGFIMYVYAQVGVALPHNAAAQYGHGVAVSRSQLQPGDLVFFNGLGHNGIYIGGGQFIHSPHTGDVVKISSLSDSWYASTWVGARRL